MARIEVDWDECEANGVCVGLVPEIFSLDDQDNLNLSSTEVHGALAERVGGAVSACPKRALFLRADDATT